jgi:hypothetical protein
MNSPLLTGVSISFLLLQGCFPTVIISPPVATSVRPTDATPTEAHTVSSSLETVARIMTRSTLVLKVGEEWMLDGDVQMNNFRVVRFDAVAAHLLIENLSPDLITLNVNQRLIKALKAGSAEIRIRSLHAAVPPVTVKVLIESPSESLLDPNLAVLELEIE